MGKGMADNKSGRSWGEGEGKTGGRGIVRKVEMGKKEKGNERGKGEGDKGCRRMDRKEKEMGRKGYG
jgi:hypothetical protein